MAENLDEIDAAEINTFPIGNDPDGVEIVVKPGKYGPYVKRGDDTASVPDDLDARRADRRDGAEAAGRRRRATSRSASSTGYPVFAKNGRYGPYVQWGAPDNLPPGLEKPKMASLFKTMALERITVDDAEELLQLPRTLGVDPADGVAIIANNGRYGPYVQKGKDYRNIASEEQLLTITLDEALEIFSQPKVFRRGGAANMAAKGPLREFGNDPVSGKPVVAKDGKFGVYVTDGETNASLSKGDRLERDAARAGLRAARDPSRGDHRKGWRAGEEGSSHQEGGSQEGRSRKAAAKKKPRAPPELSRGG